MTQADVEALLPVITPFAVPAAMTTLYTIASARFAAAAPSCVGSVYENEAVTYYIASMLSSGAGTSGVKSEKIDDYAIAYGDGGQTQAYMSKYQQIIDTCNYLSLVSGISSGQTRADTLDYLDLDNAGILDGSTEDEFA
jgi:hypothetical protein